MYLTKLYHYHKFLFAAIVFFIGMQLLVTYKRGMVISPWYNYGMYSEKMYPKQIYEVNNRLAGNTWLYLIAPQYDDKINLTLDNYRKLAQNDSLYRNEITRLFAKFHLPVPKENFYQSPFNKRDFDAWFTQYCHSFGSPPSSLVPQSITVQSAVWNGKVLQAP